MKRSNSRDASDRVALSLARATLAKSPNDKPKLQEMDVSLHWGERTTGIERFQEYGFTSVPHGPKGEEKAEVIVGFMDGNRSHGVVLAVDDRRYRPKDLKDGEVRLYDDLKQKIHLTREGMDVDGGEKKLRWKHTVGDMTVIVEKDKTTIKLGNAIWTLEKDVITSKVDNAVHTVRKNEIKSKVDDIIAKITNEKVELGNQNKPMLRVVTLGGPSLEVFASV